jgi:hypothetical protein
MNANSSAALGALSDPLEQSFPSPTRLTAGPADTKLAARPEPTASALRCVDILAKAMEDGAIGF